jgi:hypothetical protein
MESVGDIFKKRLSPVINDNKEKENNIVINDNNDSYIKGRYALDRKIFLPNTRETQLAEKIAIEMDDLRNYACFLSVVNKIGLMDAERLLKATLFDINEKANTKYPVRNKAKYFMYKFKYKKY